MGMSYLVYPGAHHTRFHHALGAMHLMQVAVSMLRLKGVQFSREEEHSLYLAILLHDIGHGPFSHALENELIPGIDHEELSLHFMEALNEEFQGSLSEAITIFKGNHPRQFFNQLVSSQLDMDRLDYLKRDSFYTGVAEGNINSERLITMLTVHGEDLMVEAKGIYSVEKFLMARRFMYWQVYLHKTGLVAEQLLVRVIRRARLLLQSGEKLQCSQALSYFLMRSTSDTFQGEDLRQFALLDDVDIMAALKNWKSHQDPVLSRLCDMLLNRRLLKIKIREKAVNPEKFNRKLAEVTRGWGLTEEEAGYFVFTGTLENRAYDMARQNINILSESGKVADVARLSDQLNLKVLSKPVVKHYFCYPKKGVI